MLYSVAFYSVFPDHGDCICLTNSAVFQGLGVQSVLLTLSRQVALPVVFIAILFRLGNLPLIWVAFILAEAVVIPFGIILWRKESGKALKTLEQIEQTL